MQELAAIRALIKRNTPDGVERFSPYDLRRTFISRCRELGLDVVAIEKAVGHQLPGMLRVYDHYDYFSEQQAVMNAWGEQLNVLTVSNVFPLPIHKAALV